MGSSTEFYIGPYMEFGEARKTVQKNFKGCIKCNRKRDQNFCPECGGPVGPICVEAVNVLETPDEILNHIGFYDDGNEDVFTRFNWGPNVLLPNWKSTNVFRYDDSDVDVLVHLTSLPSMEGIQEMALKATKTGLLDLLDKHGITYQIKYGIVIGAY